MHVIANSGGGGGRGGGGGGGGGEGGGKALHILPLTWLLTPRLALDKHSQGADRIILPASGVGRGGKQRKEGPPKRCPVWQKAGKKQHPAVIAAVCCP